MQFQQHVHIRFTLRPYSVLRLHCGVFTQCHKWRPRLFIYKNFWAVLSLTFGAQPKGLLHKWVSFSSQQPLVLVLSTWPFLLGRVFSRGSAAFLVLSQKVQIWCPVFSTSMTQLQYCGSATYLIFSFIFTTKQQNIIIIYETLFLNISFCILS